ncbi:hypothetical protein NBRC110019_10840 [Neptunitalea chrysea]|uniref:Uncharacterized protein n=1 Tax=Neptunitalea chrysea TaxID=1647581 RepID=A0A9W6B410_9FLAO|nr:hypothetical protein [Neptunitalea chrysea]GLB52045.1 hypothetical protein NBRC110019_10840 [Neptunitalea chrysea]
MKEENQLMKNIFHTLEANFPVENWKVNGIGIWPYLRIKIYIHLLSISINSGGRQEKKNDLKKTTVIAKNRHSIITDFLVAFKGFFNFLRELKTKKIVFFGSHSQRVLHEGCWFNRFFDSMVNTYKIDKEVYMVEYLQELDNTYNPNSIICLDKNLNFYKTVFFWRKRIKRKSDIYLKNYDLFLNYIQQELNISPTELRIQESNIIDWTNKIIFLSGFYRIFFKRVKPSKIVFAGYYGWDNLYAAIYQANKMKIMTVDSQTNHMVFSDWTKIPERGYDLMPKKYWNWDEISKNNIDTWASKTNDVLAYVVGQSYLGYCKSKYQNSSDEKIIFFSLQTFELEEMIPNGIISFIKNTNYKWIFRLHPRNTFTPQELSVFIKNRVVEDLNYEIQDSRSVPISEVLCSCFLHITGFSGCLLESKMMGVSTILIHPLGEEMFEDYIDEKTVFFVNGKDDFFYEKIIEIISNLEYKISISQNFYIHNPLD